MKKAWRSYGVTLDIQTPGIKKIINWGTRKYDTRENRSSSSKL